MLSSKPQNRPAGSDSIPRDRGKRQHTRWQGGRLKEKKERNTESPGRQVPVHWKGTQALLHMRRSWNSMLTRASGSTTLPEVMTMTVNAHTFHHHTCLNVLPAPSCCIPRLLVRCLLVGAVRSTYIRQHRVVPLSWGERSARQTLWSAGGLILLGARTSPTAFLHETRQNWVSKVVPNSHEDCMDRLRILSREFFSFRVLFLFLYPVHPPRRSR